MPLKQYFKPLPRAAAKEPPGDISDEQHCQKIIETAVQEFGKIDIWLTPPSSQTRESLDEISTAEFDRTVNQPLPRL